MTKAAIKNDRFGSIALISRNFFRRLLSREACNVRAIIQAADLLLCG